MQKRKKGGPRFRDRGEEMLDYLFVDRNAEIRAACKKIIKSASQGLALYEVIAERHQAAEQSGTRARLPHREFPNLQGLLWLFELELAVLLDDYLRARGERRWFYARLLLLCILESTKALRRVFNFGYRKAVAETLGGTAAAELSELHTFIHHLFEELNRTYGEVRQGLIAHRDPDAAVRFRLLATMSPIDIKDQAWEILVWCASLETIQQRYVEACFAKAGAASRPAG
jgi:hypothetical protein